jgi:hypothetical protein
VHDETGVHGERPRSLRHVVRVGVATGSGFRLEESHVIMPAENVRGRQARHPAADDGDAPASVSTQCWAG